MCAPPVGGTAVSKGFVALLAVLISLLTAAGGETASATSTPILSSPLAKLNIKDAEVEAVRGTPKGRLIIAQHYAMDPGWLDPLEHQAAATQQVYDYLVHDAMIKPMPHGMNTYSLAERAEMTADYTKAAFRLRQGLKFHDGHSLTTKDVKWT
jgi:ABC-type transport system substrate-binding protein